MPLSQWLITTNYYEGGYFRPDPLFSFSLSLFLTVSDSLHLTSFSIFTLSVFFFILFFSLPPFCLAHPLRLSLSSLFLSLSQAVMWLQLIAVEINKASKFVFLLYCVTQRKGDVFWELNLYEQGAHL